MGPPAAFDAALLYIDIYMCSTSHISCIGYMYVDIPLRPVCTCSLLNMYLLTSTTCLQATIVIGKGKYLVGMTYFVVSGGCIYPRIIL